MSKSSGNMKDYLDLYESLRGPSGYSRWLREQGIDPQGEAKALQNQARVEYARELPTYGARAESLGRTGLGNSGYAGYLKGEADQRLTARMQEAGAGARDTVQEGLSAYRDYLSRAGQEAEFVVTELQNQGIRAYDTAYAYSLNAGLDKDTAALTATLLSNMENKAKNAATVQQRATILNRMLELGLPRDAAYAYALSCGVGEDVAKELAEAVYTATVGQINNHLLYYL